MSEKPAFWMGQTKKDLLAMPDEVQHGFGHALGEAQNGITPASAARMAGMLHSVIDIRMNHKGDTYRLMYTHEFNNAIFVLHVFKKKSIRGIATPFADIHRIAERLKQARQHSREVT